MTVSKVPLCNKAYNMLKSRGYFHIINVYDSSNPESYSFTSVNVEYGKYCLIMTVSRLLLSNKVYTGCFFHVIIYCLNHI